MMRKNVVVKSVNDITSYITQLGNHKSMFLFLVIEIGLFSLPVSTIMINAQSHPSSTSGANRTGNTTGTGNGNSTSTSNETRQMGICVVGVRSPCNGNSNS